MLSKKKKNIENLPIKNEPNVAIPNQMMNGNRTAKVSQKLTNGNGQDFGINRMKTSSCPPTFTNGTDGMMNINITLNKMVKELPLLIENENKVEKEREIKRFTNLFSEWSSINDTSFINLINTLSDHLEKIDEKIAPLIYQILKLSWHKRSKSVGRKMKDFISELLLISPSYVNQTINYMVVKFYPPQEYDLRTEPLKPEEVYINEENDFLIVHKIFKGIYESFPTAKDIIVKKMEFNFPYMGKPAHVHYCYIYNLLKSIEYLPQCKSGIVRLIIHKLVRMDVSIKRSEVEEFNEIMECNWIKGENGLETMEISSLDPDYEPNLLITNLDLCLELLFEFINGEIEINDERSGDQMFETLFSVFESDILPCFGVNHIQYLLLFYVSSNEKYWMMLIEALWKKTSNVNTPLIYRIQSMAFISGILSRSQFISIKHVKRWLTKLSDWANKYTDEHVQGCHWTNINILVHGSFYAVCQAIFYIFAFRNMELLGSRKCSAFTQSLNLGRLITSDLNPLKACAEIIAEIFAKTAHQHQISYCNTVMERNQAIAVPTVVRRDIYDNDNISPEALTNNLETFFPFDPYYLPRSRQWIDPFYKIYVPYLPEVKIEKREDNNEDSIEMELSTSFNSMGKKSNFHQFMLNKNNNKKKRKNIILDSFEMEEC